MLSTIGLGFLINDAVLIPLLVAFLGVTLWGLYLGKSRHGSWAPLAIGALAAVLVGASVGVGSGLLGALGIGGLVAASAVNVALRMRQLRA